MSRSAADAAAGTAREIGVRFRGRAGAVPTAVVAIAVALLLLAGARLLTIGASDLAIAGLFSTDEQLAGELLLTMLRQGNLGLSHFFSYGPLDLYAARALLLPFGLLHPISGEAILVALRLVSLLSGAGAIVVTYLLGRRLWDAWTGALAAALLSLSATMFAWSVTAHPDLLQLFWLLLGLLWIVELPSRPSTWRVGASAACAALAFATKYGGAFLLPSLWLGLVLGAVTGDTSGRRGARRRWFGALAGRAALSLVTFVLVFLAVDPSVIREPKRFLYQVQLESSLAHGGRLHAGGPSPLAWVHQLAAPAVLGPAALTLALLAYLFSTLADVRSTAASLQRPENRRRSCGAARRLPLALWIAVYGGVLLLTVADIEPRYALPILPALALFAAAGLCWILRHIPAPATTGAVMLLAMCVPLLFAAISFQRSQEGRMRSPQVADRLAAGRWLAGHFGPTTPILHDAYAYVPDSFTDTEETFGLTEEQIGSFRPEAIVTDEAIRGRFADPSADSDAAGSSKNAAYSESAAVYAELEAGAMPCYPPIARFGSVSVYGREAPRYVAGEC